MLERRLTGQETAVCRVCRATMQSLEIRSARLVILRILKMVWYVGIPQMKAVFQWTIALWVSDFYFLCNNLNKYCFIIFYQYINGVSVDCLILHSFNAVVCRTGISSIIFEICYFIYCIIICTCTTSSISIQLKKRYSGHVF